MQMLPIEESSREELHAMALAEQVYALNDVLFAIADLGRALISARTQVAQTRADAIRSKSDDDRAAVQIAQGIFDTLKIRAGTLRELRSILQTLIRSSASMGG